MCNLEAKDVKTGLDLSTAYVPEGYSLNGLLDNNFQSSAFPFTTLTACEKQEEGIRFLERQERHINRF